MGLARLELVTSVRIRTMEANGMFEELGETIKRLYHNWGIGIFALPALIVIALVGLAMTHLDASNWMSEAARAEFAGANNRLVAAPKQLAQPTGEIHAVRSN
jgi:hypothetical protein